VGFLSALSHLVLRRFGEMTLCVPGSNEMQACDDEIFTSHSVTATGSPTFYRNWES